MTETAPAPRRIDQFRREALVDALKLYGGNRTRSARHLGVCVRTVRHWIHEFGIADEFPPAHCPPPRRTP